ncbi:MAG: hypothetical protein K0A90_00095 [Methanosarcinaceae archaeon]|nr:hypothetical protein [Methanosarcinaceae archaeon]
MKKDKLQKANTIKFGVTNFDRIDIEKVLSVRCPGYTDEELKDTTNTEIEDVLLSYGLITQTNIDKKKKAN